MSSLSLSLTLCVCLHFEKFIFDKLFHPLLIIFWYLTWSAADKKSSVPHPVLVPGPFLCTWNIPRACSPALILSVWDPNKKCQANEKDTVGSERRHCSAMHRRIGDGCWWVQVLMRHLISLLITLLNGSRHLQHLISNSPHQEPQASVTWSQRQEIIDYLERRDQN